METIILISVYLLSVLITRYAHIKSGFTEPVHLIICLIPVINILGLFSIFIFVIYELSNFNKISDWFFGIKKD